MAEIALRDLRNHTSAVLRRVEAGERLVVTVDRRPVAALVPLDRRRSWVPVQNVWAGISAAQGDTDMGLQLEALLADRVADI